MMGSGRDGLWPVYGSEDHVDALGMGELTGGLAVLSDALGALVGCPGVVWGAVTSPADLVGVDQLWPVSCMVIQDVAGHSWWGWSMAPLPVAWPSGDGTGTVYAVLRTEAAVDGPVAYGTRDSYDVVAYPSGSPAPDNALGLADYTVAAGVVTDLVALSTGLVDGDRGSLARRDVDTEVVAGWSFAAAAPPVQVLGGVVEPSGTLLGPPASAPGYDGERSWDSAGAEFCGRVVGGVLTWVQVSAGSVEVAGGRSVVRDLSQWVGGAVWSGYRLVELDQPLWWWDSALSLWRGAEVQVERIPLVSSFPWSASVWSHYGGLVAADWNRLLLCGMWAWGNLLAPVSGTQYWRCDLYWMPGSGVAHSVSLTAAGLATYGGALSPVAVSTSPGSLSFPVQWVKVGAVGNMSSCGAGVAIAPGWV